MEETECSETSAFKLQTPGNYPKESIQHIEHGESLKSRKHIVVNTSWDSSVGITTEDKGWKVRDSNSCKGDFSLLWKSQIGSAAPSDFSSLGTGFLSRGRSGRGPVLTSEPSAEIKNTKVKVIPQQAEVVQGVPGKLRPRIFLTFGTTRVVGRQPYGPTAFTPGEVPGTHFQGLSRPQGTWFRRGNHGKKSPVTPPAIDPETVRLVAQCLNHYATPGPDVLSSSE